MTVIAQVVAIMIVPADVLPVVNLYVQRVHAKVNAGIAQVVVHQVVPVVQTGVLAAAHVQQAVQILALAELPGLVQAAS